MTDSSLQNQQIFTKHALNLQGYSFQSVVLEEIVNLSNHRAINFNFYSSEYPVICQKASTHIDFILTSGNVFLIGECKRKYNFKEWCFFKMPFSSMTSSYSKAKIVDVLTENRGYDSFDKASIIRNLTSTDIKNQAIPDNENHQVYSLGLALESSENVLEKVNKNKKQKLLVDNNGLLDEVSLSHLTKDDYKYLSNDSIYETINQVLLSSSGFINELICRPFYPSNHNGIINYYFLPTIFTNANLFVSEINLSDTNLETGNLNTNLELKQVDYLWFSHNRSPELQPYFSKIEDNNFNSFNVINKTDYNSPEQRHSRVILIINSKAIRKALSLPFIEMIK